MDQHNYQIAIDVSELEAAVVSDAAESESLSRSLSDREAEISVLQDKKVGVWRDKGKTKVTELEERVEGLTREKEHIGVMLRSALQPNTTEVLKVAEDGLTEAGIEIGLNGHRDDRPGSTEKDEVYTLVGALENNMKESQIKIIELQHLVEAQRAESSLLRTRMEGQEKEIGQLWKQIKHLEEKERMANESVEDLMVDITAAEEEIERWKMAAQEEADAGRSIEQEFQTQVLSNEKQRQSCHPHPNTELYKEANHNIGTSSPTAVADQIPRCRNRLCPAPPAMAPTSSKEPATPLLILP
ncbi:hypothetical protein ZWY2020_058979 [Hordeum vulgare]|nr:hypothetical protein ZWY2020_058979 [Hordeum vulgare]